MRSSARRGAPTRRQRRQMTSPPGDAGNGCGRRPDVPAGRPRVTRAGVLARQLAGPETAKRPRDRNAHVTPEGRSDVSSTPSAAQSSNGDAGAFPVAIGAAGSRRSAVPAPKAGSVHTDGVTRPGNPGDAPEEMHNSTGLRLRALTRPTEPPARPLEVLGTVPTAGVCGPPAVFCRRCPELSRRTPESSGHAPFTAFTVDSQRRSLSTLTGARA